MLFSFRLRIRITNRFTTPLRIPLVFCASYKKKRFRAPLYMKFTFQFWNSKIRKRSLEMARFAAAQSNMFLLFQLYRSRCNRNIEVIIPMSLYLEITAFSIVKSIFNGDTSTCFVSLRSVRSFFLLVSSQVPGNDSVSLFQNIPAFLKGQRKWLNKQLKQYTQFCKTR